VHIEGPIEVAPGTSFTIDVIIQDIGSLPDLDFWNLRLQIVPQGAYENAQFAIVDLTTTDPDYVFYNNSFDFQIVSPEPGDAVVIAGDAAGSAVSSENAADSLLAKVQIGVSAFAQDAEFYGVQVINSTWSLFGDTGPTTIEPLVLNEPYSFEIISQQPAMPWISLLLLGD
jgi:hypothetical protein